MRSTSIQTVYLYVSSPHFSLFRAVPRKRQRRFKQCSAFTCPSSPVPDPNYAVISLSNFEGKVFLRQYLLNVLLSLWPVIPCDVKTKRGKQGRIPMQSL